MDGLVWSNDGMVLTGEPEVLGEKAVPVSHITQKSHTIWPRIEPGTPPFSMPAVHITIPHVTQTTHFVSIYCAFAVVQLKSSQYVAAGRRHVVARHFSFGTVYCFHFKGQNPTNLPGRLDYWVWHRYVVSK